jgi:predicted TIM-barrel fold metal-dependent hydrolase
MAYTLRDELRNPGIRGYNRWLAAFCQAQEGRRVGIAVVPIRDVDAAIEEAIWAKEHGLGGISLPVLSDDMPHYGDPVYEPFWSACEELELPLNVHGGAGRYYGTGPVANALILAECDWFTRRALWMLIFAGVFERNPRLRLVFTEQRTHWVRPTLDELDSIYRSRMTRIRSVLPRAPSEYFAENCYVGASFFSPKEAAARHDTGVERLMWGSDFPHVEGAWPYTRWSYRHTFSDVPEPERRAILGENAIRCYGLNSAALTEVAKVVGPTNEDFVYSTEPLPDGAESTWAFRRTGAYD